MAASSSGRDLSCQTKKTVQNLSKGSTGHEIDTENASRPGLLTDMLNYDNSMDNDEFTALFTSQTKKLAHPIECLSLTLEEVTHIRQVLTKAELETLITNHEMYNLVSKGKVCFTCKLVKFSMFGQWGTRCKICKRNVCNTCLRKMNIPTEHFQNIPVHTLSPIPLSPETLDLLKVYERTGSVPHTPSSERKTQQVMEEPAARRTSLQRSHTIGSGSAPTLPNKNLLRGPQMSVCCDCKTMIMEIIRTSRTSIALIHKGQEAQPSPTKEEERGEGLNLSTLSLNIKQFFNK